MTQLLQATTITAAQAAAPAGLIILNGAPRNLSIQANFTYGSGGTTVDAYVQSSVDGGNTWFDLCNFHFTTASGIRQFNLSALTPVTTQRTPTDGSITANTAADGLLGPRLRVKLASTGTYAGGTTLAIDVAADQLPA